MPFESTSQVAKFAVLEREGKLPQGTLHKWASETPSIAKLPRYKHGKPEKKLTRYRSAEKE